MGAFKIEIVGVGGHGCERKAKPGEKLFGRCGRFNCPDCEAYDFVQRLRQKGMVRDGDGAYSVEVFPDAAEIEQGVPPAVPTGATRVDEVTGRFFAQFPQKAEFTHWPGDVHISVVDDMLKNERKSGQF